mmetsp:Transcript_16937/g.36855  ORF Transcript_16937/g.36855 Transcript_16937/m.36855 type:complete len:677 (+) Transcript_16937:321-2351(+)
MKIAAAAILVAAMVMMSPSRASATTFCRSCAFQSAARRVAVDISKARIRRKGRGTTNSPSLLRHLASVGRNDIDNKSGISTCRHASFGLVNTRYVNNIAIDMRLFSSSPSASVTTATNSESKDGDAYAYTEFDPTQEDETIFALSSGGGGTAGGATAVSVIRLTGPRSHDVLRALLVKPDQTLQDVKMPRTRMASLRTLWDPTPPSNGRDQLDSALVLTFDSPRSFTGEDVVEIHCHGSRAVVRGILDALTSMGERYGLRPADRGDFTQRAYARGKLDLTEVEALADLITADTSLQRKQALRQFDGTLSRLYEGWRSELTSCLAHAEAVIDFGDDEDLDPDDDDDSDGDGDDGGMSVWGNVVPRVETLLDRMERHMSDSMRGEITRDGLRVAIVGPPNAGKSSFLNVLSNRDAAIVSPVAGTTRDVVEVTLDLGGVRCTVSDTAGVRERGSTDDIIEVEGIKRARRAAADAHVIVCMVDATDVEGGMVAVQEILDDAMSSKSTEDDGIKAGSRSGQNIIFVTNKVDLIEAAAEAEASDQAITIADFETSGIGGKSFEISCETNNGIDALIESLTKTVVSRVVSTSDESGTAADAVTNGSLVEEEGAVITRARHRRHVEAAAQALQRFTVLSKQGYMALDMAAEELRLAASELGRVTGAIDVEDVLDVLFADFCIGK